MRDYVFLFRTKAADDRDCCAYIDLEDLKSMHIGCDGKFNIHGACYSVSLGGKYANYEYSEIDTILTENQYNRLINPDKNDSLNDIIETLTNADAENYFEQIIESEKEYISEEYNLSADEVETIFDEYALTYQDRGVISYVWRNYEDLGIEYIESCYSVPEYLENYIDYEKFGRDLVYNSENYIELDGGWIVELNY